MHMSDTPFIHSNKKLHVQELRFWLLFAIRMHVLEIFIWHSIFFRLSLCDHSIAASGTGGTCVCLVYRLVQNMNWNYRTLTWLTRSVELLHKNPSYRLCTHEMNIHISCTHTHTHAANPSQWLPTNISIKDDPIFFFFLFKPSLIVLDISSIKYGICLRD